ncbi:hypothetical protein [Caloramator sp. Dgby_cultured_2]|uniref:hypothetical protein n=1 Tax=Caloramator sp. Dgby_cultured_2 TaxID=3029174 RepID=UPI00237DE7DD|nr:hypothetical protein [Caloramator sp. Dgby_cultured_2]WDU84199.1 hypothetical protein PWK10_07730 [Caloramator sp. Dgby_cultured_2]
MREELKVLGKLRIRLIDENGNVREEIEKDNLIVNNGKYGIADQLLASPTIGKPTHMGIGTGTTAPTVGDTALVAEVGTRQAFSSKTRSNNVVTMVASFGAGNGTGAITEAGIFNASSGGTMFSRITFSAINKGANDTLELTWTYTIG